MNLKKMMLVFSSILLVGTYFLPVSQAFANEIVSSQSQRNYDDEIYSGLSEEGKALFKDNQSNLNELRPQARGVKKKAMVLALKYGGNLLSKVVGILSKKNANLLKKHAFSLGTFLDSISTSIEARLVSFMIHELKIPSSAARTIAWAISQFIF
ncbi:hypothetical protein [Enterococcus sp. AZ126]|uniref:hypothetical protein n=1 Tax=Enterococcus sp. AZ126 TaxID=2774635 RepID=UPI003F1FC776